MSPRARYTPRVRGPYTDVVVNRPVTLVLAAFVVTFLVPVALRAPTTDRPRVWTDPVTRMPFTLLPPGTFRMGSPPREAGREDQEILHEVTLTRPFYMARYELTQAEWTTVMSNNPSRFRECPRCPVENVTWFDVQDFIRRLNARSIAGFRLPTEAEWEYACRAGGSEPFGRSSSLSSRDANINGNYPYAAPRGSFRERTLSVGSFPPNRWQLFDLAGNVWEWTGDAHCPYDGGPISDPLGRCEVEKKVIRGGSWMFDGNSARCALRYTHRPQDRGPSLGVRLAHDVW